MEIVDFNVGAVIPAAGLSERMGGSVPKQYSLIMGKPLFLYALQEFLLVKYIKKIALVVDNIERALSILKEHGLGECEKVILVLGSHTRHRSIKAGLQELYRSDKDSGLKLVIVHDGVRPFICSSLLSDLVKAASSFGAAGFVRPLVSTVLSAGQEAVMEKSLIRSEHVASETPQAFQMSLLLSAYDKCSDEELDIGTECLQLVQNHCGINGKLIFGKGELFKVTHKEDLLLAEALIRERSTDVCIIAEEDSDSIKLLQESLQGKVASVKVAVGGSSSTSPGKSYNVIVMFHRREIQLDLHLITFASLTDLDKQGLIIHVIEHASVDGLHGVSAYKLHRNSRKMAYHHEKLKKGVVLIDLVSSNETQRLVDTITTLVTSGYRVFSGQTLFI